MRKILILCTLFIWILTTGAVPISGVIWLVYAVVDVVCAYAAIRVTQHFPHLGFTILFSVIAMTAVYVWIAWSLKNFHGV